MCATLKMARVGTKVGGRGSWSWHVGSRSTTMHLVLAWILFLLPSALIKADDMFNFVDMQIPKNWEGPYQSTCTRRVSDTFREPRGELFPDSLRAPLQTLSPVEIKVNETVKSPNNRTLHIYSNPGVRSGYSVSYGFQKNKECLHGQDAECIVSPDFGRVRALVLNAERFKDGQNLNFIKDHFLIEEQEKFVSILNGGSMYERKFTEAVFLGGYPHRDDPRRSSHVIDGKNFPLEIYMYFVDETLPSMTLSTILVVLVEESDKDNHHIKPIVNTVEKKLYDAERQFIEKNRAILRRERLFHALRESTQYNIFDEEKWKTDEPFLQKTLHSSKHHESILADFVETYERLEALEAELQFLDEDLQRAMILREGYSRELFFSLGNYPGQPFRSDIFPSTEMQFMALIAFYVTSELTNNRIKVENWEDARKERLCQNSFNNLYKMERWGSFQTLNIIFRDHFGNRTYDDHWDAFYEILLKVCFYAIEKYELDSLQYNPNNSSFIKTILTDHKEKYRFMNRYRKIREKRDEISKEVFKHFHTNHTTHFNPWFKDAFHIYFRGKKDALRFGTNLDRVLAVNYKFRAYSATVNIINSTIQDIKDKYSYPDDFTMRQIIRYLKHGSKNLNLKFKRSTIHDQIFHHTLPLDEKRRGFVEYGNMEMTEKEIKEMKQLSPVKVIVDQAFQVSWLMPQNGGYYYYPGSSPVPPCFRAQNVIVFKKPISMSRNQIEWLTRIPVSLNRRRDIVTTKPVLHDVKYTVTLEALGVQRTEEVNLRVYHQNRSHIFLGHDGVHENAIELLEKANAEKEAAKEKEKSAGLSTRTKRIKADETMMVLGCALILTINLWQ